MLCCCRCQRFTRSLWKASHRSYMPRHQALNDLIWRALSKGGIPPTKEPSGLSRTDGKRPDGVTLSRWSHGKEANHLLGTLPYTLADSYVGSTALLPGCVAEMAAERKTAKYITMPDTITFQPIAFETLGPINQTGVEFLAELGHRLHGNNLAWRTRASDLFQRLSLTVQRFNAVAFRGCFADVRDT